jgi:hypothetical protein
LPAQTGELTIRLRDGTELAAAERVEPSQDGSPAPVRLAYWYDVGGSRTASAIEVKGLTVWHSLVRRQSSGAVVVVRLRPGPFATPESARDAIRGFIGELLPSLGRALSAGASAE